MSRPSAPGTSVDISGAAKVAARRLRGLGKAFPIDFTTKGGTENELMTWYRGRPNRLVRTLQLRREREEPYFHQFIVFELNGEFFRIDRRLRPDEDTPLNSLKDEGIPAYDTIEPVATWDDALFPASDCLTSIDFRGDVYLALILKICQVIQSHPLAKVYTLQRYNCYFFAQTIMLCAARGAYNQAARKPSYQTFLDISKDFIYSLYSKEVVIEVRCTQETLGPGQTDTLIFEILRPSPFTIRNSLQPYKLDSFGIRSSEKHQQQGFSAEVTRWKESSAKVSLLQRHLLVKRVKSLLDMLYSSDPSLNMFPEPTQDIDLEDIPRYRRTRRTIFRWRIFRWRIFRWLKAREKREQRMRPTTINGMQKYLVRLIDAHSIRVEQYKWATKAVANDVASDIRKAMDEVWDKLIE
ncbi:hypothetical protein V565_216260 [Rhizoctonia solani 123E]|uniref:Uncharacterized protein n=1 Tax=Rhizoctonia solani 123E TaxID=1423351 RepID=A0A074RLD3_9AGAM|nr:hypothetical protein V565_216260 [Rhizoctonia solani 123E]